MVKQQETKTNVMRILDQHGIPYRAHFYESGGPVDGVSVAKLLAQDPAKVYKTLVARGKEICVFVIPVESELDLKAASRSAGEKAVSMLHVRELPGVTGYVRGGCSPIGMKKRFCTVVDESCLTQETICVSAGKIGAQVELSPLDLLHLTGAGTAALTRQGGSERQPRE